MAELPRSPTGETDYAAMVEVLKPQQQREMMGLVSALAKYLKPEYLKEPPLQNMPTELGKVPPNQIDWDMARMFGGFDLASMFMGGGAGKAGPALAGAVVPFVRRPWTLGNRGGSRGGENVLRPENLTAYPGDSAKVEDAMKAILEALEQKPAPK